MSKIVVKFGGSNLKSKEDINQIVKVVKSYEYPVIIVVSAFYGITDQLERLKNLSENGTEIIKKIFEKHKNVLADLTIDKSLFESKYNYLNQLYEELKMKPGDIGIQNRIMIFGELFSASILKDILIQNGLQTKLSLPEDFKLLATGKLKNASVSKRIDYEQISNYFKNDTNYIVPGFYGQTSDGKVALFGRGGSDYTASVLAAAVNARSLDLWKDVSGFLSSDPKIVSGPKKIDALTYLEAAELSYFGAKIIHPGTIRPLLNKSIPLNIYSINFKDLNNSQSLSDGTKISDLTIHNQGKIKSITYSNFFVLLKLKGAGVGIRKGILRTITELFDSNDINIRSVITSQIEIDFLLHQDDCEKAIELINNLSNQNFDLVVDKDISLIAAVGSGIKESHGIAGNIFGALAQAKINIKHIVFGASDVSIYLIVAKKDLVQAIESIHHKIFNNK